jgi:purine-binding chemotaxis protein CheW
MTHPSGQHVVFTLSGQEFGMPIREVREILRMLAITRIPELPPGILGVINLRGTILPVLDVAGKLHLPPTEPDDATKILVAERPGGEFAFLADKVTEVLDLTVDSSGTQTPEEVPTAHGAVVGVATGPHGLIVLLDPAMLLGEEELAAIDNLTRR